jgi:hypothetical protein
VRRGSQFNLNKKMAAYASSVLSSGVIGHSGVKWILGGWGAFLTENLVLSQYREQIIGEEETVPFRKAMATIS